MSRDQFPNVRVRLQLHFAAPALPERRILQTIWLRGSQFRVRDEAGRPLYEVLHDVTAPRGLGLPARTMEAIMDRQAAATRPPAGVTEVFGDLATDVGWVYPPRAARWTTAAHDLAPLAEQVLAGERTAALQRTGPVARLGRAAVEYRGTMAVEEDGVRSTNTVVRVVDPPFLLLDDVRDAGSANHYYVREIVELTPDVVTDADLALPP